MFVVAGFTSSDYGMGAVGLVLCIAGACLAVLCDLLRRFGCGWRKIMASRSPRFGDNGQENPDADIDFPYLPGYPGFSTAVVDNPPSYAICSGEPFVTSPDISCSCGDCYACVDNGRLESSNNTDRIPEATCTTLPQDHGPSNFGPEVVGTEQRTLEATCTTLPQDHGPSNFGPEVVGTEQRTLKPSPPPYDFVVVTMVTTFDTSRLSWLRDSPPPYAEFV